jgi:hypothetical protein
MPATRCRHHAVELTEVRGEPRLFVGIEGEPFVSMAAEPAVQAHRPLRSRPQAARQHRQRHAGRGVQVHHTLHIRARRVHRAVDREPARVDTLARAVDHLAARVDLDQR